MNTDSDGAASDIDESIVSIDEVRAAAERIRGRVVRTPLLPFPNGDPHRPLWLKPESLQPTGAFKLRGAYNKILAVRDDARARGIVAHSSGNHAQAVAWVARDLGIHAVIVIPDTAPQVKVRAVLELGAEVELVPFADRTTRAVDLAASRGYVMVPPYDDRDIVAGAGTIGLEIAEDLPDVDVVFVPVSGGGLISGVATALKQIRPSVAVIGVEPELAADAAESFRMGHRQRWPDEAVGSTIADGLRVTSVGDINWTHIARFVDDIVTVTEDEIRDAVARLARRARLVVEPSGAVTLAAYLRRGPSGDGHKQVAVISGGNVDPELFTDLLRAHHATDRPF